MSVSAPRTTNSRIEEIQRRLDAMEYPITHCYSLADARPNGILQKRVVAITDILKDVPHGISALEVGFNKGFFLRHFSDRFESVDGCEPWREYFDLVSDIRHACEWARVRNLWPCGFAGIPWESDVSTAYDLIFMGNCMHYVYRDSGSFDFFNRLAEMCRGYLLIEGFASLDGEDAFMQGARKKWPDELQGGFSEVAFERAISPHFELVRERGTATGEYRWIRLYRRRDGDNNSPSIRV